MDRINNNSTAITYENKIYQKLNLYDVGMMNESLDKQSPLGIYE